MPETLEMRPNLMAQTPPDSHLQFSHNCNTNPAVLSTLLTNLVLFWSLEMPSQLIALSVSPVHANVAM